MADKKQKILIVDDSEMNRDILAVMLGSDYEILEAENGLEAIEILQQGMTDIDLILLDIMMPEMDGLTATRRIRSLNRPDAEQIPIFAVTAGIFPGDIEKIKAAGMTAYLPKPLVWEELIAVLERYCEKADCPLQCV